MFCNRRFGSTIILLLLAIALPPVCIQAQLPAKRVSRFGRSLDSQRSPVSPALAGSGTVYAPQGMAFTFGLVDFPRSPDTVATGLNSRGDIVGLYGPNLPLYQGTEESFALEGNTFQQLIYPGASYTLGQGINKSRNVVGWYSNTDGNAHAFLRKGKEYSNIDFPGADNTIASNINDAGEIIGIYYQNTTGTVHGFLLSKGVYTTLDPPNSTLTQPLGINSDGIIVGGYEDQNSVSHGFIYQRGQFTTVDYPATSNTQLTGINDQGQMVGGYGDDVIIDGGDWPTPNAFFLDQGIFTPFQVPVDDAQITLTGTLNGNQFVGFYIDNLGNFHGYQVSIGQ
jgi:uncharacterized membrane protein